MPRDITLLALQLYKSYAGKIPYAYGCYGQKITKALATAKGKQYPAYWPSPYGTAKNSNRWSMDKQFAAPWGCDCIGFIRILCLYDKDIDPLPWKASNTNGYVINGKNWYNIAGMDISANAARTQFGAKPISSIPEPTPTKAVCVFMTGHVGLYVGDGVVIEQTPPQLVATKLSKRKWTHWAYLPDKWRDFIEVTVKGGSSVQKPETKPEKKPSTPSKTTWVKHTVVKGDTPL